MDYRKRFTVLVQVLIHFLGLTIAQRKFNSAYFCIDSGNYTQYSAYENNLLTLLFSLSSNLNRYGFNSASFGENSDRVNGIVLCRGDVQLHRCKVCLNSLIREVLLVCPNNKEIMSWFSECTLRYSPNTIIGFMINDANKALLVQQSQNVTSLAEFRKELTILANDLRGKAASGGPFRKFASGVRIGPDNQTIYALEQCTPDITADDCSLCLTKALQWVPTRGPTGLIMYGPSCHFRYEIFSFFNDTIPQAGDSPQDEAGKLPLNKGENNNKAQIIIIFLVSIFGVLLVILCIFCYVRKQKKKLIDEFDGAGDISGVESLQNDFNTIKAATNDFSDTNKLGQGGFGSVYKGKLENGQEIAVKRLSKGSGQGDIEFKNEVVLVAKLQHRNLVRLRGFCLDGSERLLIYEFMPNGSLDHIIFGTSTMAYMHMVYVDSVKRTRLDWEKRYKIIGGVAKGLLYLHEDSRLRIIHRDLKASNVLLDEQMNPKISDFGMARLFVLDETQGDTSRIVGTYGYMAPEYAMYGLFSPKSDVFSFGILVLEIVSGKKYNFSRDVEYAENLSSYAWKNWRDGTPTNIIEPILRTSSVSVLENIIKCIHIGLLCVQENVSDRPTMASVFLMLTSSSLTLPIPSEPAFLVKNTLSSDLSSDDEESETKISETTLLRKRKSKHGSENETSKTIVMNYSEVDLY